MTVFDVHHHVVTADRADPAAWEREYETRIRVMEDNRIDEAVIQPSQIYDQPEGVKDTMRVNEAVAAYRERDPRRFPIAIGTAEPMHGMRALEEVEQAHGLGLNGIGWHHFLQGRAIDADIMRPILSRMRELRMVPFIHIYAENPLEAPSRLENLATEFPDVTFIALDGFSGVEQGHALISMMKRTPNILFDTALLSFPTTLVRAINEAGSERILLGTNLYSPPALYRQTIKPGISGVLELVRSAHISDSDRDNILGLNAQRLFGLVPALTA